MAWPARSAAAFRGAALTAVAVSVLLVTGCGATPILVPVATPSPTARAAGDSGPPVALAWSPLRGTRLEAPATPHPSIAVKIDNHEEARPQIALNRSDIAFEELVEGGLTRYLVVWQSDVPESVGPVRSVRPMDPDIASPFGGIMAYSGGQEQFVEMMMATPLVNVVFDFDDTGLFERADERPGPHDVILASAEAVTRNSTLAPPPDGPSPRSRSAPARRRRT